MNRGLYEDPRLASFPSHNRGLVVQANLEEEEEGDWFRPTQEGGRGLL